MKDSPTERYIQTVSQLSVNQTGRRTRVVVKIKNDPNNKSLKETKTYTSTLFVFNWIDRERCTNKWKNNHNNQIKRGEEWRAENKKGLVAVAATSERRKYIVEENQATSEH